MVHVQTFLTDTGKYYWFESSGNFSVQDGIPPDADIHGPFDSETEATADSEQVLLGGIEVIDGGDWDPARLKPH